MATRTKYYIVTEDLRFLMEQWCKAQKLDPPEAPFFEKLKEVMCDGLRRLAFSEPVAEDTVAQVFYVKREDFGHLCKPQGDQAFWIALDDVYARDADYEFRINRVFSKDGQRLGVGIRLEAGRETPSLGVQLHDCASAYGKAGGDRAFLVDDGAYTGGSLRMILEQLEQVAEIPISRILLGFCTHEALDALKDFRSEIEPRMPLVVVPGLVVTKEGILDWVCERDFFLCTPRSGRASGEIGPNGIPEPYDPPIGRPYVHPWGDIGDGASIRRGKEDLSALLTDASIRLWDEIERLNERRLRVCDVPRFPGPSGLGNVCRDHQNADLLPYLEEVERREFGSERRDARAKGPWFG